MRQVPLLPCEGASQRAEGQESTSAHTTSPYQPRSGRSEGAAWSSAATHGASHAARQCSRASRSTDLAASEQRERAAAGVPGAQRASPSKQAHWQGQGVSMAFIRRLGAHEVHDAPLIAHGVHHARWQGLVFHAHERRHATAEKQQRCSGSRPCAAPHGSWHGKDSPVSGLPTRAVVRSTIHHGCQRAEMCLRATTGPCVPCHASSHATAAGQSRALRARRPRENEQKRQIPTRHH